MSDVPFLAQSPSSRYIIPEFRERTANGERVHNPYTKLFEERIIFLGVQIDDASADDVMAQLLTLESMDPDRDIQIYINSPGGSYTAMTAIYDTMQFVKPQVQTVCLGQAASAASVLLAAGTAGKRFALPHARVLIHQPYTEGGGQGSDIEIQANEILRMRKEMEVILARHTGRSEEQIEHDIERDKILTADMAKEYGIIDQVISDFPSGLWYAEDAKKIFAPPKEKIMTSMEELIQNFMIVTEGPQVPPGEIYFEAENPKGALGFYLVSKGGGVPYRLKIRAPSFCNLSILEKFAPGHMLSDITVILGSLDFVMGECDR